MRMFQTVMAFGAASIVFAPSRHLWLSAAIVVVLIRMMLFPAQIASAVWNDRLQSIAPACIA